MTSSLSDAVAASSMLLAVVAVLFGVWNGAVDAALALDVSGAPTNQLPQRRQLLSAILTKAIPLAVGAWLAALVFFARSFAIVKTIRACQGTRGCHADDVSTAFLLTEGFVVLIALVMSVQLVRLVIRWIRARTKKS